MFTTACGVRKQQIGQRVDVICLREAERLEETGTKTSCLGLFLPAATERNTFFLLVCGLQSNDWP